MKYLLIIILLHGTWAKCQLASLVWHGDTLYCVNPSNGYQVQLNKDPVNWSTGVLSKPTTLSGFGILDAPTTSLTINSKPLSSNITLTPSDVGLGNVTNESKATMFTNPTFTGTVTLPNSAVTNTMLAGSIDLTTKVTGVLPFSQGGIGASAATSATTGTMTVNMTNSIITVTPTGSCTFNASGGVNAQIVTFIITTSGTSSFTLTWGTNFKTTATLATGTVTAKTFCVTFLYTGSAWIEVSRTAAM